MMHPAVIADRGCVMGECPRWDDDAGTPAAFAGALFAFDPGVAGTRRLRAATHS
jgi:hypothetical protein